jgi:hypothetical protein
MNGIGILAILAAAILVPILLLIALGYFVSRWVARRSPNSQLIRRVTPLQALQYAIIVAVLMAVTSVGLLHPTSTLGKWFAFPYGIIAAMVLAWLVSIAFGTCVVIGRRLRQKHRGGA